MDLMRIIFICGVLLNHTTSTFEGRIDNAAASQLFLEATHLMLHFTRMGFMFMTGLVLTLNYYNRKHEWLKFERKRFVSAGIPYLAWNFIVMFLSIEVGVNFSMANFKADYIDAIVHGNQFYMYYILIVLQLYLIFPLIVLMFKKLVNHHTLIMSISFTVQMAILIFIKYFLPHIDDSHWWWWFKAYGENVLTYQFYFLAGTYASIHYKEVKRFINTHIKPIAWITGILSLGTVGLFFFDTDVLHLSMGATMSVHQPYMLVYDIFMIAFVFWVGLRFAYWRQHGLWPWIDRWVHNVAKVSFGLYLVQTIPLAMLAFILTKISLPAWAMVLCLPIGYVFVVAVAFGISWFCYKVPPFGILIGRNNLHFKKRVEATQEKITTVVEEQKLTPENRK
ncbi:Acyltransferase [Secundilactobacillus paracollinoides DSM 15502 = JCM 11969]|nr:Acyltransferase [Secundilactobacillus paracollinoides DSM 15502 = JCM 11969]